MSKKLGDRISELLKKRNISQKELATQIGVTEAAMSRYIAGTREPKPDVLANIATALHTTSDYLLGIENDDFNYNNVKRIIARNSSKMTEQEKKALIDALFGEE
jgi:transcriptional regulator with XRE-family HTH domain